MGKLCKDVGCAQHAEVGLAGPISETQNSGAPGLGFEVRARC